MNKNDFNQNQSAPTESSDIRAWFPALSRDEVYLDNAGGTQVPRTVIERIRDYMTNSFVQLGADYPAGLRADEVVAKARDFIGLLMNANSVGQVILGSSTSALLAMLADCYARSPDSKRNEIVVCEAGHEANIGPWQKLTHRGYTVHTWRFDPETLTCPWSALEQLLGPKTRLLAVPHVSNLLGNIEDIQRMARMAHQVGARIAVDGVAYAPHRAMDVAALGVDWYVYSIYKVYGPHMAALFGTHEALAELEGPNHFFVNPRDVPHKFELGGVLHEGCAGVLGIHDYFCYLAGMNAPSRLDRPQIEDAFAKMTARELPLQKKLIEYLMQKKDLRLIGPSAVDSTRVGTVSFVHRTKTSKEIALAVNGRGIGIRYGHFYAHRLAAALGVRPDDGVVRTSLVHYNSQEDIDRLIGVFETQNLL